MHVISNKKGINKEDIILKIYKGSKVIGCLNSLWWDSNIFLETKKQLGKLWLTQWLAMDMKFGFLREREKKEALSSSNGLFKKVS